MRKHAVAALWLFAASLVLVISFVTIAEANTTLLDRTLSLSDLALQLKTPDKIAHYMWRHFLFEQDQRQFGKEEYWQTPEEFLASQKGDCEDFASFATALLRLNGTNAFILNVYGDGYAHTLAVFEENGAYHVIDGTEVQRYEAKTLPELLEKIHPFWRMGAIVAPSSTGTGTILKQFNR